MSIHCCDISESWNPCDYSLHNRADHKLLQHCWIMGPMWQQLPQQSRPLLWDCWNMGPMRLQLAQESRPYTVVTLRNMGPIWLQLAQQSWPYTVVTLLEHGIHVTTACTTEPAIHCCDIAESWYPCDYSLHNRAGHTLLWHCWNMGSMWQQLAQQSRPYTVVTLLNRGTHVTTACTTELVIHYCDIAEWWDHVITASTTEPTTVVRLLEHGAHMSTAYPTEPATYCCDIAGTWDPCNYSFHTSVKMDTVVLKTCGMHEIWRNSNLKLQLAMPMFWIYPHLPSIKSE